MRLLLIVCLIYITQNCFSQVILDYNWCLSNCDAAGDEKINTKLLYSQRAESNVTLRNEPLLKFPLRFVKVASTDHDFVLSNEMVNNLLTKLNIGFEGAKMQFYIDKIDSINIDLQIEDLVVDGYRIYNEFSQEHDLPDVITVYVFNYDHELCEVTPVSISCGRTSGFSYILSDLTNNIVLSKFDLEDDKVIVHEMGHFFGLYHTFEEIQFGKDNFVEDCNIAGDCLCDTPPDPGPPFDIYVNHSACKMIDLYHDNGNKYDPIIENYMAYYKPCYLIAYSFTEQQLNLLNFSAQSAFRNKFSRE